VKRDPRRRSKPSPSSRQARSFSRAQGTSRTVSHRNRLTPSLIADFHRLLFTWRDRELRRNGVGTPWEELSERLRQEWTRRDQLSLELEEKYGDGHYQDRKKLLDDQLKWLEEEPVDLPKVLEALRRAVRARRAAFQEGREADERRLLHDHQKLVENLRNQAAKARRSYLDVLSVEGPIAFEAIDELVSLERLGPLAIVDSLGCLIETLDSDPFRTFNVEGPYRREKTGRLAAPWLKQVRTDLRSAGAPDDPEDNLLVAVGLMPYRRLSAS
jgi:hypothetical protein